MKRILCVQILALIMLLSSCATLIKSGSIPVAPLSANGQTWVVRAEASSGWWSEKIVIYINKTPVATSEVTAVTHEDEFSGRYRDHIISGNCVLDSETSNAGEVQCAVYIDGVQMTTLKLF